MVGGEARLAGQSGPNQGKLDAMEGSRLASGSSGQLLTASNRAQAGSDDASLQ